MSNDKLKPKPVHYIIHNFGKTRIFPVAGMNLNLTQGQVIDTTDLELAKALNGQYMIQVTKKTTGLPL